MSMYIILFSVVGYFGLLMLIAWYTSNNAGESGYFTGNKQSPWYIVAFGLIGDSLSGVTFISVPGAVATNQFSYMQMVLGYIVGYLVIAQFLLPLYYKLNLISIYSYLEQRFGKISQKTGSLFFILSRLVGAAFRLYIALIVLDVYFFSAFHIPFFVSALIVIGLILLYTYKGGIKTLVWTDTLQSAFLLGGVALSIYVVCSQLNYSLVDAVLAVKESPMSKLFFFDDWMSKNNFFKQFLGGMFIAIAMTGLDQEMMQKNISVKTLGGAQKNMVLFSSVMVLVNFLFLLLGGVLYLFASSKGILVKGDDLFPTIALDFMPVWVSLIFIIGLISALFPSADGAITALTSSFCIDIIGLKRQKGITEEQQAKTRKIVHLSFAVVFLLLVFYFKMLNNKSIINILLDIAGYTYGPLLGLFAFGILTKCKIKDHLAPFVCLLAPMLCFAFQHYVPGYFGWSYQIGIELLLLNGALTFAGLLLIRK